MSSNEKPVKMKTLQDGVDEFLEHLKLVGEVNPGTGIERYFVTKTAKWRGHEVPAEVYVLFDDSSWGKMEVDLPQPAANDGRQTYNH